MNPILECQGLSKKYTKDTCTLSNLNLILERGQIIGLLGPNGSGKTTLIKLLNGILTPTEGKVFIAGFEPGIETKKIVSYLPERPHIDKNLKISEILHFFADFYDNFNSDRASRMLSDLNINPDSRLRTLSKGTQEKVLLILTMSRDAELYILDEPIGGVDPAARDYILQTIISTYNENATILLSTHLISDIENILDRAIFLQNGRIVLNATVDEIRMSQGKSIDTLFREVFRC